MAKDNRLAGLVKGGGVAGMISPQAGNGASPSVSEETSKQDAPPPLPTKSYRLPRDLTRWLAVWAKQHDRTESAVIIELIKGFQTEQEGTNGH